MRPRICICCGEPMAPRGNSLSRNPNVCASCSSRADGMEKSTLPAVADSAPAQCAAPPAATNPEAVAIEAHAAALPS